MKLLTVALLGAGITWTVPPSSGVVVGAIDAVTIRIDFGARIETVRMIGVGVPDQASSNEYEKRVSEKAVRYVEDVLLGKKIRLQFDDAYYASGHRDSSDRIIAYVFLGDLLFNLSLVRNGYAYADEDFSSHTGVELKEAEEEARLAKLGLWKDYVPPRDPAIYISPASSAYHRGDCPNLGQNRTKVHIKTAIQLRYQACGTCGTDRVAAVIRGPAPQRDVFRKIYYRYGFVTKVVDGDTLRVDLDGVAETVRMLGVDAPDPATTTRPAEHYSPESARYTRERLEGKKVRLEMDNAYASSGYKDGDGKILAYVYSSGRLFNLDALTEGYARVEPGHTPSRMGELRRAEREAFIARRGLWAADEAVAGVTVYLSRIDRKYHYDPCLFLDRSMMAVAIGRAVKLGYEPCAICAVSPRNGKGKQAPLR